MKYSFPRSSHQAFTLIELLVTIAIIALLTGIIITSLTGSRAKARDAKRISDLGQIQLALELFFDRCRVYPGTGAGNVPDIVFLENIINSNNCPPASNVSLSTYISKAPTPPTSPLNQTRYDYVVNKLTNPTDYFLHIELEAPNEIVKDGIATPLYAGGLGITCDTTIHYCLGPK